MRLVVAADLHGFLPNNLPAGDVLVLPGDICPDASSPDFSNGEDLQAQWLDTTFREWLEKQNKKFKVVVGVAGNHDFVFQYPLVNEFPEDPALAVAYKQLQAEHSMVPDLPWTYLQDEGVIIGGLRFWGTPWVPFLDGWAFYGNKATLKTVFSMVPNQTDVLITHGPPKGCADYVRSQGHVGSKELSEQLLRIKPKVVLCGHIHEESHTFGRKHKSGALVYNAAIQDVYYKPVNKPVVVDVEPDLH